MTARTFLDTNVLVYAFDGDQPAKQAAAREILYGARAGTHAVSPQVLQEFFNAVTRKLQRPVGADDALAAVKALARLTVVPADADLVLAAIELHRRHQLLLWDALIVQAALVGGCTRLLTEDLQDGFRVGTLVVENPFRGLD
jgi:predicted nucleic acid-binding protein